MYLIEIIASAKSWRQNLKSFRSFLADDDLAVKIDELEFPKQNGRKGLFDAEMAWNGNRLKGLLKTGLFALYLKSGEHKISFLNHGKPFIKNIKISKAEEKNKIIYIPTENNPAQSGNRRPWLSLALVNLAVSGVKIIAKAAKRENDDDDLKLIINSRRQSNNAVKAHKYWYWCGKILKGERKEFNEKIELANGVHYIELWADEAPFLESIEISLRGAEKNQQIIIKPYLYKGVSGQEDYNRYDELIREAVNYWNDEFFKDADPAQKILDPNLAKAMIFQESRMGYDKENNGAINVMQIGNYGNASLDVLNGRGEKAEYELKDGRLWELNYNGEAKVEKPYDSIYWGVRWLYHKAQGVTADHKRYWLTWREAVEKYGPPDGKYADNVWSIYTQGTDKRSKPPLKLWLMLLPLIIILLSAAFWFYHNQDRIFFSYNNENRGHWQCGKQPWLEVTLLDGLKLKRIIIDEVNKIKGECSGLIKNSVKYSYVDLDNDGEYEIALDGRWDNGNAVKYFLEIEKDGLAIIPINGLYLYGRSNSLNGETVILNWPDKRGRYTFAVEAVVGYINGPDKIFRDLYHYNDKGEIELFRRETEELTGDFSKFGAIAEMPL